MLSEGDEVDPLGEPVVALLGALVSELVVLGLVVVLGLAVPGLVVLVDGVVLLS